MDNSISSNPLHEIHRAQRTLDELEFKLKSYQKQKKSLPSTSKKNPKAEIPDIQKYISYLMYDNLQEQLQFQQASKAESTLAKHSHQVTQKYHTFENQQTESNNYFNLEQHTRNELQKSRKDKLEKIEQHYRQNCQLLDERIKQLEKTKQKLKKDKVLLMHDNEELERKIQKTRKEKENKDEINNPQKQIIGELIGITMELKNKIKKIQQENQKIRRRKKELQQNMRQCLKNSKDMVRADIQWRKGQVRKTKSKSMIGKYPFH